MNEYAVHVCVHPAHKGMVKVLRLCDGMPIGTWVVLEHMELARTMSYLYTRHARYCYYQENEHTLVYTLKKG
jgi:hypothetical protein